MQRIHNQYEIYVEWHEITAQKIKIYETHSLFEYKK